MDNKATSMNSQNFYTQDGVAQPNLQPIPINASVMQQEEDDEIDLMELVQVLLSKIWILIAALVIGAAAAGIGTKMFITPQYESSAMVYIYSKTTSITSLADLQIGSQLTEDFQIIATTREVVEGVIEELGLNTTYETLVKQITVDNPSSSHIITITVKDPDPERACVIANAMANAVREQIAEIMNTDEPSMVQKAIAAKDPVSPSTTKNALIGGAILFVLVAAFYVVRYLLDDTIKTEDDVKKYLGTAVLAIIPYNKAVDRSDKYSGKNRSSEKSKK